MHVGVVAFALIAVAAAPAQAAGKLIIAPVQASDVVAADIAVELEEAVRAGVMHEAPALDLRVMSHATLTSSLLELAARPGLAVKLPCASTECDAAVGRMLGTQYSVSTRLTKLDGKYLALFKLVADADDRVLATNTVEGATFGALLKDAGDASAKLARDALGAAARPSAWSPPAPAVVVAPEAECRMGADGRQACGFHCKMGADGNMACADAPNGKCAMGADGHVVCSHMGAPTSFSSSPPDGDGENNNACKTSIDCGAGSFCKDRGDGRKVCMGNGARGDACKSTIDCGGGLFCKDAGNGRKVCR